MKIGMGPVCRRKFAAEHADNQDGPTLAKLPFDPATGDIICQRSTADKMEFGIVAFNFDQAIVYHSDTGMEWGYPGSGPADFALNVLALFLPDDGLEKADFGKGRSVSRTVADWYQIFKDDFIVGMPHEGGTIEGKTIKAWLISKVPWLGDGDYIMYPHDSNRDGDDFEKVG
jgi:hypothetical protein